uniref:SCO-spondin n=1 Tax=Nannospalax galili TaxID=1026970 RepID=A0A8C6QLI4_NANGA
SCQVPCSGRFRLCWREAGGPPGEDCKGPWAQTESCNMGSCPGCRCPPGQLVQDGRCVSISSCCCGLPRANASWELAPIQVAQLDCYNCTCISGSLVCPHLECPVLGPWSAWSQCSAACGGGIMERHRSCEERPGGAPCQALDLQPQQACSPKPCPECVLSTCATMCPSLCSHLQP